jgi:hypothetical protein
MQSLFQVLLDIALWRRGPRDLPAEPSLLARVAVLYAALSAVQAWLLAGPSGEFGDALLVGVVDLAFTATFFWVVLAIGRRPHRALQTLSAILGTLALLSVPMTLLLLLFGLVQGSVPLKFLASLASLPILAWYLFVIAHVVRAALDAPLATGMATAVAYAVASYFLIDRLLPATGTGG